MYCLLFFLSLYLFSVLHLILLLPVRQLRNILKRKYVRVEKFVVQMCNVPYYQTMVCRCNESTSGAVLSIRSFL